MIKALIFDLDGVIVDTAHYHFVAWQRLARELGIDFTEKDNERLKGVSRMRSLEIILEIGNRQMSESEKERLATRKNAWFVEYIQNVKPDEIFPGVKEMIQTCKAAGFRVALASSSKNARTVLRNLKVEDLFEGFVDGNMITHSKPNPEIFLKAAAQLGVEPQHCVVFEDAEAGVEAALAAGMKCVGVGSPENVGKANQIVKNTADFKLADLAGW
ncbi:MAG: beta-phosphoglucomutase [Cyclobacteriaceae bacterium]|nr:beta-phosphoglucomutase [Cyclobacteriaceae bacterium]MCE2934976.1 beta-phosphoglucomutase [Flammeovirgaceae bacterium]